MRNKLAALLSALLVGTMVLAACGGSAPATEAPAAATEAATEAAAEAAPEAATEAATEAAAEVATEAATEEAAAPAAAEAQITIWADALIAPMLEGLAPDFLAEYGVGIVVVQKAFGSIRDDFKVAGPAGEGPDLLIGAHDWLGELVTSGLLAEVDLGANEALFVPGAVSAFSFGGKQYGMPFAVENVALYYNTELVPTPPTTWDEVKTMSADLKAAGNKYGFLIQENDPYHFYPIQTAFGGYVFGVNEDGSWNPQDVGIDSEGTVAAFSWLDGMYADGLLDRGAAINGDLMNAAFQNGDSAMMISGPWNLTAMRDAGVPFAVAKLPAATADAKPFLGVQGFMVSAFSKNAPLAQAFLQEFLATEPAMQAMYDGNPRPSAFIPVNDKIADPEIKAFADAGATALAMPNIPEMSAVWSSWGSAMQLISQGTQTPAEAMKAAAEQIRTAIGQ
jgi:maltose-binding protein MalE